LKEAITFIEQGRILNIMLMIPIEDYAMKAKFLESNRSKIEVVFFYFL
jgi:hypothetical protein